MNVSFLAPDLSRKNFLNKINQHKSHQNLFLGSAAKFAWTVISGNTHPRMVLHHIHKCGQRKMM